MRAILTSLIVAGSMALGGCITRPATVAKEETTVAVDSSFKQLCADSLKPTGKGTVGCLLRIQVFEMRLRP